MTIPSPKQYNHINMKHQSHTITSKQPAHSQQQSGIHHVEYLKNQLNEFRAELMRIDQSGVVSPPVSPKRLQQQEQTQRLIESRPIWCYILPPKQSDELKSFIDTPVLKLQDEDFQLLDI
jgi:hypothetical protein